MDQMPSSPATSGLVPPDECAATPAAAVDAAAFRQALSCLAGGTSIVTTSDQDGRYLGLTATAVCSVSVDPPLLLVCIANASRSLAALQSGAGFVVHFLSAGQEALAWQFATGVADKFAGLPYRLTASGCPRLDGALATVECVPVQVYPGGDHRIVVGRMVHTDLGSEELAPLIYFRRRFIPA